VPAPEHVARYRIADLVLDTFPYNGHATTSDALWAGCPVLTYAGQTFPSRVAGSLLKTIGISELITYSLQDYEQLAVALARDADRLGQLRHRLEANRETSPLFDCERFTRNLEDAYRQMHEILVSGQSPRSFAVER
jgi:predicted O-linked N-acetylglucosamine transferase (SPINDLY family)